MVFLVERERVGWFVLERESWGRGCVCVCVEVGFWGGVGRGVGVFLRNVIFIARYRGAGPMSVGHRCVHTFNSIPPPSLPPLEPIGEAS